MSEIDVSKCYYYNADNSPFCCELYDDECKAQNCYFQQLQQLKAENEELCTAIRNELPEQYNKRVSEAESDIEWGVLDRNATEAEFCKNVIYETRNYIAKLKQENDELQEMNNNLSEKFANVCGGCFEQELREKYKQCLDEIEEICNKYYKSKEELLAIRNKKRLYAFSKGVITGGNNVANRILQLIKQAKESEE